MTKATLTLLSFPVLTKDFLILSLLLVFSSALVASTTDDDCGEYCGKNCVDLLVADQDLCKDSHDDCDCFSIPPKLKTGAIGRLRRYNHRPHRPYHSHPNSGASYVSRNEECTTTVENGVTTRKCTSGSGGGSGDPATVFIVIGVIGAIFLCVCICVCIFFCTRSSSRRGAAPVGGPVAPYGGAVAPYGAPVAPYGVPVAPYGAPGVPYGGQMYVGQPQMYQPFPSQPVESGAVGSNYGVANY